ncbi:protein of unknown function [Micropruina glycogenica]|uniref:Uncharacterized protein n=1 Tax=Micropruina glycogenica TaxID=75385 RepID=A0A2N9JK63_9ACTN|nr:protein of unknown function [Micropruina glycogenica]
MARRSGAPSCTRHNHQKVAKPFTQAVVAQSGHESTRHLRPCAGLARARPDRAVGRRRPRPGGAGLSVRRVPYATAQLVVSGPHGLVVADASRRAAARRPAGHPIAAQSGPPLHHHRRRRLRPGAGRLRRPVASARLDRRRHRGGVHRVARARRRALR